MYGCWDCFLSLGNRCGIYFFKCTKEHRWNRQKIYVKVIMLTVVGDIISTAGVKSDSKKVQTVKMILGHLVGEGWGN